MDHRRICFVLWAESFTAVREQYLFIYSYMPSRLSGSHHRSESSLWNGIITVKTKSLITNTSLYLRCATRPQTERRVIPIVRTEGYLRAFWFIWVACRLLNGNSIWQIQFRARFAFQLVRIPLNLNLSSSQTCMLRYKYILQKLIVIYV